MKRRLTVALATLLVGLFGAGSHSSAQGSREGVKVHGHWTIEIRQPDGTLVSRREFENALAEEGKWYLVGLFARLQTVGVWKIELSSNNEGDLPCKVGTFDLPCYIQEPTSESSTTPGAKTLVVAVASGGAALELRGSIAETRNGVIDTVRSIPGSCSPGMPPLECKADGGVIPFTMTSVSPGIRVVEGQIIQVKVVISFS